jgi:Na+/glutamate symporter
MIRKSRPELRRTEQRIRAIGEDCMKDEFPMFRRRITTPLSVLGGVLVVLAMLLDHIEPYRFDFGKAVLLCIGMFALGVAFVLRLWRKTWR